MGCRESNAQQPMADYCEADRFPAAEPRIVKTVVNPAIDAAEPSFFGSRVEAFKHWSGRRGSRPKTASVSRTSGSSRIA